MSLLTAMSTGVSGLDAESDALGVIGNNVSNSNTIGFKESRAIFENVMGSAIGAPDPQGAGVMMGATQQIFTQGSLNNTGNPMDLALSGDGFFVVNGTVGGQTGDFYTRAGATTLDSSGKLVNPSGMAFQGYAYTPSGQLSSTLSDVTVKTAAVPPKATTEMTVTANLDANAATPTTTPFDPQNPTATSNFSTGMQIYDSLGQAHTVNVYFTHTGAGTWDYHVLANGSEVSGGTAGTNSDIADGTITFNNAGAIQSIAATAGGTVTFNGANAQTLKMNLGSQIANGGTGLDGITQFGSPSNVSSQSQDGFTSGDLSGVTIDANGNVNGTYTNGQTIAIAQLAVAKFTSNTGLAPAGQSVWAATAQSGQAALGQASNGGRGAIVPGTLEQSNVDIASEFVGLIQHQRAFEANSKTIQTADQMLQAMMQVVQ
jgi:flagellar hook protein FlgE